MIGIIGGNGVAATNKLNALIEEKMTMNGAYRDAHHPEIITWQATKVPSRSMYLEGKGESFIPGYIEIGKMLKNCGCTDLCMCCNTAHYAIDILEKEIDLPFINIIEEVALKIKEKGCKRIGIMCSDGLRNVNLYDQYIKKHTPDAEVIYPSMNDQILVTKGICNSKNTARYLPAENKENPKTCFEIVCKSLERQQVDCIVAGCTDICNVYQGCNINKNIIYIDSLVVLSDAIIKKITSE